MKNDRMASFNEFHNGLLALYSFSLEPLSYCPNVVIDAMKIQQYMHICLLNLSFKIFTKVATNRITIVTQKFISPTQTAFIPGRNIMEGVVILY
jgi:hypothetical protein